MTIQVLVATMNRTNKDSLIKEMRLKDNFVIINQLTTPKINAKDLFTKNRKFLSFREKGLSKSRNKGIHYATADICVIADDDMYYDDDYEQTISRAYESHPDADVIAFKVANEDPNAKSKEIKEGRVGFIQSMKLSSVRITFKRDSVVKKNIRFNENFGAGAQFYAGEENIFLADCLKEKLNIYYVSQKIATLRFDSRASTWFQGYNEYYFNVKGLVYYRMSKFLAPFLILQFAIRKRHLYHENIAVVNAIKCMFEGIAEHKPKKSIYFAGDFVSNTGPANVNKKYGDFLKETAHICRSNNKIIRTLHFTSRILLTDKVVISGLSNFHLNVLKLSKLLNKEVSYLMHGYSAVEYKINGITDQNERLNLEKDILENSDRIICVSENFSRALKDFQPHLKNKITFVNNGVDQSYIYRRADNLKAKKQYTILSIGGGVPLKNILKICEAISQLDNKNIKFVVIGDKNKNGHKIASYPFVKYHQKLDHDKVLDEMSKVDLYIQNSTFETFSLATCEALSLGCDLLISKNVGAISILKDLDEHHLINSTSDTTEIREKIKYLKISDTNKTVSFTDNSTWNDSAHELMRKLESAK